MALVKIEIFKKSEENRPVCMALIQDNDENILFSPFIFKESLNHFEETCENSRDLFQYTIEEITKRKEYLNSVVKDVPSTVNAKIDMIIHIIKNRKLHRFNDLSLKKNATKLQTIIQNGQKSSSMQKQNLKRKSM